MRCEFLLRISWMLLTLRRLPMDARSWSREDASSFEAETDKDLRRDRLQTPSLRDLAEKVEESLEESSDLSRSLLTSILVI
jgi:hypothetical protein